MFDEALLLIIFLIAGYAGVAGFVIQKLIAKI
jgi:hypothetical protein